MILQKTDEKATVVSVQDTAAINPIGNKEAMGGYSVLGSSDLPGSVNCYTVRFQLSDGTFLDSVVTGKKIEKFSPGDSGKLVTAGRISPSTSPGTWNVRKRLPRAKKSTTSITSGKKI